MPWKHDVFLLFSCSTKTLVYSLFSWTFSIVFPSARTLHFPSVFPQSYQRWMQWKHDVCWLFSCSTKTPVYSLFSWPFFYSFPKRANVAFSKCFHTESRTVKATKTCCSSIVFLLHGNGSKQLALFTRMFFCRFRERTCAEFPKCFHSQLLTVNVKKTWCSSIIYLLHGNANE